MDYDEIRITVKRWNDFYSIRLADQDPSDERCLHVCREYGEIIVGKELAQGEEWEVLARFKPIRQRC